MRKHAALTIGAVLAAALPAGAASAQPCRPGAGQGATVVVSGFKERTGSLRILAFEGEDNYKTGRPYAARVTVPVTGSGTPMQVCLPLPRPGTYAISVRHDINGNGESDRSDGGGFSGNPRLGIGLALSRRNPDWDRTRLQVAAGSVVRVPVTLNYLRGLSIGPVRDPR